MPMKTVICEVCLGKRCTYCFYTGVRQIPDPRPPADRSRTPVASGRSTGGSERRTDPGRPSQQTVKDAPASRSRGKTGSGAGALLAVLLILFLFAANADDETRAGPPAGAAPTALGTPSTEPVAAPPVNPTLGNPGEAVGARYTDLIPQGAVSITLIRPALHPDPDSVLAWTGDSTIYVVYPSQRPFPETERPAYMLCSDGGDAGCGTLGLISNLGRSSSVGFVDSTAASRLGAMESALVVLTDPGRQVRSYRVTLCRLFPRPTTPTRPTGDCGPEGPHP